MLDITTRAKLIHGCSLIFYGIPVGKNAPGDTPVIGNQSLAQVVVNRIESVAKNREEFKFMVGCIMQMIKETKGRAVEKIRLEQNTRSLVRSGLTDSKGFVIPTIKKIY